MNLKEFLFYSETSVREFAKICGLNATYISSLINGKKEPSKIVAGYIELVTNGQVKPKDIAAPLRMPNGFIPLKKEIRE